MKTTVTEYKARFCGKCGGSGIISAYQHKKGGVCFRCGGSGNDEKMTEIERPMTDDEVLSALDAAGFPVIFTETPRVESDDFLSIFLTDDEVSAKKDMLSSARSFLAAL